MPLDYYYLGDVKNVETQTCLDTMGRRTGENVGISYCHGLGGNQVCVYFRYEVIHTCDENQEMSFLFCALFLTKAVLSRYLLTLSGSR